MSPIVYGAAAPAVTATRGIPLPTKPVDYGRRVYEHTPRPTGLDWAKHTAPKSAQPTPPPAPTKAPKTRRRSNAPRKPRLPIVSDAVVATLYAEGLKPASIALQLDVSETTIRHTIRRAGLAPEPAPFIAPDELAGLVDEGLTAQEIAARLRVAASTVRKHLRINGLKAARPIDRQARTLDRDEAERLHREGWTQTQIANHLGVHPSTVGQYLSTRGLRTRATTKRRTRPNPADVVRLYVDDELSIPKTARALGCSGSTVRRVLLDEGITLRDDRGRYSGAPPTDARNRACAQLYTDGLSREQIAARLDLTLSVVDTALRATGHNPNPTPGVQELLWANRTTSAQVRAWAATQGKPCPGRGIPPRHLVEDYLLAQPGRKTA